jgi:hypothetical protein
MIQTVPFFGLDIGLCMTVGCRIEVKQRRAATAAWTSVSPTPAIAGAALHILSNGELYYNGPSLSLNNNYVLLYCRYSLD